MPILEDYHIHSWYSADSMVPMEQTVQDALRLGLAEICFTDHVDYGVKQDWQPLTLCYDPADKAGQPLRNVNYPAYFAEVQRLQRQYAGRIAIRSGLEFGVQTHTIPLYEQLYARWPMDFVILSCHQVEDTTFWDQRFQTGRTQQEYQQRYYEEILQVIRRYRGYSVLGHLDMIARYDKAGPYPFENIREVVTAILRQAIEDGKGLEVNTSCWRYGLSDLTPCRDILRLYRALGGEILTIGSDAHKPGHLGAHLQETIDALRALGFSAICTFQNGQPIFHDL